MTDPSTASSSRSPLLPVVAAASVGALFHLALTGGLGPNASRVLAGSWWTAWLLGGTWVALVWAVGRTALSAAQREALLATCAGVAVAGMGLGVLPPAGAHLGLPMAGVLLGVLLALALGAAPTALETALDRAWVPWACGVGTSAWFFIVSYARHAWFGSGCKDMGLFLQSVWLLSRGQSPDNTVMGMNAFADHMEFVDLLFAPLLWVWPDAGALLLGQAFCAGMGAVPLWRMARQLWGSATGATMAAVAYFTAHQIGSGVMFDWNPTTVSIGFFVWAVEAALSSQWRRMAAFLTVIGLCKENLLLYVCGFGVWLAVRGAPWRVWVPALLVPAVAFVVEVKFIFPRFREGGFRHFYFQELGTDLGDVALNVLRSPARALTLMFNPAQKLNGLLLPLSSTAFLVALSPALMVSMLPGMLERFGSTFQNSWWGHHYGGPYHALALCGAVLGGARLQAMLSARLPDDTTPPPLRRALSVLPGAVVLCAGLLGAFSGPWGASDLFVLRKPYHPSDEDRVTMNQAVASVPDGVPVAAQNYLLPHLATRPRISMLEHARDATHVVMTPTSNPWPYDRAYTERLARELLNEGWRVHFCAGNSFVLARDAGPSVPCAVLGR